MLPVLKRRKTFRMWGWISLGIAGVLAGVGAAFGALENKAFSRAHDRDTADRAALDDLISKGKLYRNVSIGLYAGAAAAVISTLVLFIYERRGVQPENAPLPMVNLGPTRGGGVAFSLSKDF